jgi:predicted nucleic acid-binding protein
MVLVDSSVWIELFRKKGDVVVSLAVENLIEEMQACCCGIVKLEVLGGARDDEKTVISNLFSLIPYLPQSETVWDEVIRFQWRVRKHGLTIPWSDALIAVVANKSGSRIYSRDKHFDALAELGMIQPYTPGYGGSYQEP